ncbi:quinol monooxygenase YgiN [Antricoccus suffuscus]|uniref:Quinol monooxygenase YgiN n=1 Tax=Antricoccus suffuscus TaxID=1629062 RepID=A0A2T0ZRY2_9ACTN|nr:putative quinol monooxygenase [Antricoccus suffuscus]PRZ39126.1 quinol monooxygenase YgiN [Antricoccus suffuscus]
MSIVLLVEYKPIDGRKDDLLAAITDIVPEVHAESGCERYAYHSTKDGRVFLIETWADKEALGAHAEGAAIKKLQAATKDLVSEPATILPLRPAPMGDPAKGQL